MFYRLKNIEREILSWSPGQVTEPRKRAAKKLFCQSQIKFEHMSYTIHWWELSVCGLCLADELGMKLPYIFVRIHMNITGHFERPHGMGRLEDANNIFTGYCVASVVIQISWHWKWCDNSQDLIWGCCNIWYPSEVHLNIKSREIPFALSYCSDVKSFSNFPPSTPTEMDVTKDFRMRFSRILYIATAGPCYMLSEIV